MYRVPMQMVSWRKTRWTVWILHDWDFFDTQVHEGWWGDLNVQNGRIPSWWRVHENYWMSSDRSVQRGATAWGVSGLKKETTRKRQMAKSDNFAQIDLDKLIWSSMISVGVSVSNLQLLLISCFAAGIAAFRIRAFSSDCAHSIHLPWRWLPKASRK